MSARSTFLRLTPALLAVAVLGVLYSDDGLQSSGWTSPLALILYGAFLVLMVLLVVIASRAIRRNPNAKRP